MVGLLNAPEARVQAVVTLFGPSDFREKPPNENVHALLDELMKKEGEEAALGGASPITHMTRDAPPFLLIHGDNDEAVSFSESANLQRALQAVGVRCGLIRVPNGPHATGLWSKIPSGPDWERQMTKWLNRTPGHHGPVGQEIRARQAS